MKMGCRKISWWEKKRSMSLSSNTLMTFLFCKHGEGMLVKLKDTLELFEWCSGQKINWEKSAFSGVNVSEEELNYMAGILGCHAEKHPFMYLGLPLGGYPRKEIFLATGG